MVYIQRRIRGLLAQSSVTAERPYGLREAAADLYRNVSRAELVDTVVKAGVDSEFKTLRELLVVCAGVVSSEAVSRAIFIDMCVAFCMDDAELAEQDQIRRDAYLVKVGEYDGLRLVDIWLQRDPSGTSQ